jgi:phytoene dehydrogenase-like protein
MTTAAVVGSGPNGLAAAVTLARAGVRVTVVEAADTPGGGMHSAELLEPGVVHDLCSAIHPMAAASPFFRSTDLARHGLEFAWPEVQLAHPLDDGSAGTVLRGVDHTAAGLGRDAAVWRATFAPFAARLDDLMADATAPPVHVPAHPFLFTLFGANVAVPAALSRHRWRTPQAQAVFTGVAAHVFTRLDLPLSSSVGMLLTTAAQATGWPVAVGGSAAITRALVAEAESLGVRMVTGTTVRDLDELAALTGTPGQRPDIVQLDTSPQAAADILAGRQPSRQARAYHRFRSGAAAFPVHYVVRGDVPWTAPAARDAACLHLGGTAAEVIAAERDCARGVMPDRPFVLVGQQYRADPTRSAGDLHPLDVYAHVPAGFTGDATEAVTAQIERFAPGFRDTVVACSPTSTTGLADSNPNLRGGDIIGGHTGPVQLLARPVLSPRPYRTGVPGVYLCSASTPPGAGVHGMGGMNAAELALREVAS